MTLAVAVAAGCTPSADSAEAGAAQTPSPDQSEHHELTAELESLEEEFAARVGVSAIDTADGTTVDHRAGERFGFASSLKVFAVAELLDRTTPEELDRRVTWSQADVDRAGWTPVTEKHVDNGLPLADVAESALRVSDNAAMNIVLDEIGGPEGLDAALEDAGDPITEVVDEEPELNVVEPDSPDNTTTPDAFTANLAGLLDPERLSTDDRELLLEWMSDNATGDPLIRAGAPVGWTVRDKSGHSDGIQNDVAVVTPPPGRTRSSCPCSRSPMTRTPMRVQTWSKPSPRLSCTVSSDVHARSPAEAAPALGRERTDWWRSVPDGTMRDGSYVTCRRTI